MSITLQTELTPRGIVCTHPTLGKVATIERKFEKAEAGKWFVFPYAFPAYERGATFHSLQAAEFYAVALAHEMHETGALPKAA